MAGADWGCPVDPAELTGAAVVLSPLEGVGVTWVTLDVFPWLEGADPGGSVAEAWFFVVSVFLSQRRQYSITFTVGISVASFCASVVLITAELILFNTLMKMATTSSLFGSLPFFSKMADISNTSVELSDQKSRINSIVDSLRCDILSKHVESSGFMCFLVFFF